MNSLDKQYQSLLQDILDNGVEKNTRNGKVLSVFGRTIRYKFKDGKFPLLTTKKMHWKSIVTELLWFLRGDTNIKFLVDNDCHIWDGDAYKNYVNSDEVRWPKSKEDFIEHIKNDKEWEKKWGELGPVYGKQWRSWGRKNVANYDLKDVKGSDQPKVLEAIKNGEDVTKYDVKIEYQNNSIDQIANLINELKTNPDSRRLMVSAWAVHDLTNMVLPPCHYGFQVYTRKLTWEEQVQWVMKNTNVELENLYIVEEIAKDSTPKRAISLMWNQRSVDTFLGLPFNIASYGLLLEMIADEVQMIPDELIGNLGDTHLYLNHIEQAKEQIKREPFRLPNVHVRDGIESFMPGDIILENYVSHPTIKAQLSN